LRFNSTALIIFVLSFCRPHTSCLRFLFGNFFWNLLTLFLIVHFTCLVWHFVALLNRFVLALLPGLLSAHVALFVCRLTALFINSIAHWLILVLTNLMMLCVADIPGQFLAVVVVFGLVTEVFIVLAHLALGHSLVLWLDGWYIFAFFLWQFFACFLGHGLANWNLLFCAFLLWNLVTHCLRNIATLLLGLRDTVWFGWVIGWFAHLSVLCLTMMFILLSAHLSVHSMALISILVMATQSILSLTNLIIYVLADLLVVHLAVLDLVVPAHVGAQLPSHPHGLHYTEQLVQEAW